LLIPVFYVALRRVLGDKLDEVTRKLPDEGSADKGQRLITVGNEARE